MKGKKTLTSAGSFLPEVAAQWTPSNPHAVGISNFF